MIVYPILITIFSLFLALFPITIARKWGEYKDTPSQLSTLATLRLSSLINYVSILIIVLVLEIITLWQTINLALSNVTT